MWGHPLRVLLSGNGAWQITAGGWHGTLTGNGQVKVINKYRYEQRCGGLGVCDAGGVSSQKGCLCCTYYDLFLWWVYMSINKSNTSLKCISFSSYIIEDGGRLGLITQLVIFKYTTDLGLCIIKNKWLTINKLIFLLSFIWLPDFLLVPDRLDNKTKHAKSHSQTIWWISR